MKKIQEKWNLKLLYKSDTDPQIEKDMRAIEKAYAAFEKKYKGKDFTTTPERLKRVLEDVKALREIANAHKTSRYFSFRKHLNSQDDKVVALGTKIDERFAKAGNRITFFNLALGQIPASLQKRFLADPRLKEFHYLLKKIFRIAKYNLSEKEEQLVNLLEQTSYEMWVDGQSKLLDKQTVTMKGKAIPVPQATGMLGDLARKERLALYQRINEVFKNISHFAEAEINAIYNFKKVMDERRGFKKPYSSTVLSYENDEQTVESLVKLVTRNFRISHRFYKLHAKILKERKLSLADRNVPIGEIAKKFDFNSATSLVEKGFAKIGPWYAETFKKFLENGQIDVYPRAGKRGGAYSWGGGKTPTYILLNHTDNVRSVETIAHEMGHSFHTELAKSQPVQYQGYSTAVAEVASTFFEQIVVEELEKELGDAERAVLLHAKLMGDISTIFRQIAFFNFELELHEKIRQEGTVSKEDIAKLFAKHLRAYLGEAFDISEDDGYFFVFLSHMRRYFYVYSYAYGQLISRVLFEKWKADPTYIKKIEQFLSAGSSMSPKDIFKSIGIDTTDPKFFETGLKAIEKDIEKLERLTKKR